MSDVAGRMVLEAAYLRLAKRLESKSITTIQLKQAAMEALASARQQIEHDSDWLSTELDRLNDEHVMVLPPARAKDDSSAS